MEEEFARLHKDGKSLLKAESKFVQFLGLQELTDRACDHVELANPTKNVRFSILVTTWEMKKIHVFRIVPEFLHSS